MPHARPTSEVSTSPAQFATRPSRPASAKWPARRDAAHSPELSLIIPTFNERDGVGALLESISAALEGLDWEAVFVDDSTDGTDYLIAALSTMDPRVRLLHRAANRGGLAGAVVDGLAIARGTYVC